MTHKHGTKYQHKHYKLFWFVEILELSQLCETSYQSLNELRTWGKKWLLNESIKLTN
jgi:hypothetical protein